MDPTTYHQVSPPTRLGGRAVSGLSLGLFLRVPNDTKKAVPIIGEQKTAKPTPSLVSPKGESLAKPAVKTTDTRASAQPKILGPSGQQVHASPSKPSPFEGSTAKPKSSGPSQIFQPGATPSRAQSSGGILTSPHESKGPSQVLGPSGQPVSSRITEGPGAAKPGGSPTIHMPGSQPSGSGKVELASSTKPRSSTSAQQISEGAQWDAAISAAKKREGIRSETEARARPLDFTPQKQAAGPAAQSKDREATAAAQAHTGATPAQQKMLEAGGVQAPKATPESGGMLTPQQQKMMAAADGGGGKPGGGTPGAGGGEGGATGKPGEGGDQKKQEPGKGPNILGHFQTGYQIGMQNDPSATVSLMGHRAAAAAQGALSPPTPHEQARMQREAIQQRAEMLRQNVQSSQSSMQRSLAAMDKMSQSPPVRSGLRRS